MWGNRRAAYPVYLALSGATGLFSTMVFTIAAVYRVKSAGLNPFELVLVGTVLEAATFAGEIPTGVVADVYSRRLSTIIGIFLIGVGFVIEGSFPIFGAILIAQIVWGIGYTFTSGATDAWIADEAGGQDVGRIYLRGAQLTQIGSLVGIFVSVALASIRLNLPYLTSGGLFMLLALTLVIVMPERHFSPASSQESRSWHAMRNTFLEGARTVRRRPVLITILVIGAFMGMASEAFDRLWEVHFLDNFTFPRLGDFEPVVWFGIINAVAVLLSVGATEVARRRVDSSTHQGASRALLGINLLLIASIVVFGVAGSFEVALAAYWASYLFRRTSSPIYSAWINQSLEPRVRATVLSMASQVDALGQIVGGPILGAVATLVSIRAAMVGVGITLSPAIALFARTMRRPEETEVVVPVEGD